MNISKENIQNTGEKIHMNIKNQENKYKDISTTVRDIERIKNIVKNLDDSYFEVRRRKLHKSRKNKRTRNKR